LTSRCTTTLYWHTHRRDPEATLTRFDPTHTVRFDLEHGQITRTGSAARLLLPAQAVVDLCGAAGGEALRDFGRQLGTEVGRLVSERLGPVDQASIESMLEHLGGELALMGLGSLAVERWGRALVLKLDACPLPAAGDAVLSAVLEGALQRAASRDVRAVVLSRDDSVVRLAILGAEAAPHVAEQLANGAPWADVLARIQHPRGGA
jgi:hypothetical protein